MYRCSQVAFLFQHSCMPVDQFGFPFWLFVNTLFFFTIERTRSFWKSGGVQFWRTTHVCSQNRPAQRCSGVFQTKSFVFLMYSYPEAEWTNFTPAFAEKMRAQKSEPFSSEEKSQKRRCACTVSWFLFLSFLRCLFQCLNDEFSTRVHVFWVHVA